MSLRAAIAALDDAALEAAASKGLLRRAHRDQEAGLATVTRHTPDGAELAVDGETVALDAGGLGTATCTCPAQGVCRHVLAAVIALRVAPTAPTPEAPDSEPDVDPVAELIGLTPADLVKAFGRAALRDAELILTAANETGAAIAIEAAPRTCRIKLPGQPDVLYLAGLGLAGMISKDPAPLASAANGKAKRKATPAKALQAAAVLAVRRLNAGEATIAAPQSEAPKPAARATSNAGFLDAVTQALAEAARSGLATAPRLAEERLLDLALSSRADALPRLAGMLRGIAEDMSERRARAAAFEPAAALAAMARTYALVVALRKAGDDADLRGAIRQSYADLPARDFVGCGLDLWQTPTGARGVTAHALAFDDAVPRSYTLTLARAASQDPFFVPRQAARSEPVWGRALETLAASGFRLEGARATADGRLSLGGDTRLTLGDRAIASLLTTHSDLFIEDWSQIASRIAAHISPSLRANSRPIPLLLRPAAVEPVQFDTLAQRAWLPVMDRQGRWLDLTIETGADDTRLDAIIALEGVPRVLVVLARRDGADIVLSPIAALMKDELASFDLWEPPRRHGMPPRPSMLERIKGGLGALVPRPRGATFAPVQRPDAAAALVASAEDEALALAELGGRMEDRARLDKLARIAGELETAGLSPLAGLLLRLATASARERPLRLLAFKHAAACHVALAPRLPWVRRIA